MSDQTCTRCGLPHLAGDDGDDLGNRDGSCFTFTEHYREPVLPTDGVYAPLDPSSRCPSCGRSLAGGHALDCAAIAASVVRKRFDTLPTPAGTFLSVDICPRHGFAMLALATLDDSGNGSGTRLLGPKNCCPDRREVARWRVVAETVDDLRGQLAGIRTPRLPAVSATYEAGVRETLDLVAPHLSNGVREIVEAQLLTATAHKEPTMTARTPDENARGSYIGTDWREVLNRNVTVDLEFALGEFPDGDLAKAEALLEEALGECRRLLRTAP